MKVIKNKVGLSFMAFACLALSFIMPATSNAASVNGYVEYLNASGSHIFVKVAGNWFYHNSYNSGVYNWLYMAKLHSNTVSIAGDPNNYIVHLAQ